MFCLVAFLYLVRRWTFCFTLLYIFPPTVRLRWSFGKSTIYYLRFLCREPDPSFKSIGYLGIPTCGDLQFHCDATMKIYFYVLYTGVRNS